MIRSIDLRNPTLADRAVAQEEAANSGSHQQPLNPRTIAFLTLVNNESQYDTCLRYIDALQVPPGYTVEKIAVLGATSMAEGYQRAMEASTARYKIYVHQDVYLVHRGLLLELVNLFRTYPRLGMVGVVGTTRMSGRGIWWVNNPFHCYGRVWVYAREGGFPMSLFGRRLHLQRFRPFAGDCLPAVAVDGLFLATQYDMAWANSLGGFELYDQVQAVEFIKAGLEVGIARQETVWCIHWGPPQERSRQQRAPREVALHRRAVVFRERNRQFISVPVRSLSERYRGMARLLRMMNSPFGDGVTDGRSMPRELNSSNQVRECLGIVIVTRNGREVLFRALRALLPQCEELKEVEYQVVVVDNASTDGTVEAIRREFPQVTVIADPSNVGRSARGINAGLRHLSFPSYVLVMHDDVECSAGTLGRMVRYLREQPSTAGVIPSFTNPDGTDQLQRTAIVELVPRRPGRPQLITFVGTAYALVRGEAFFDVGLYDERFQSCRADLDWSLRAKRKEYRFVFLPEAKVIHHRSTGSGPDRPAIVADRLEDNLWLMYKHAGRRWATVLYWTERALAKWLDFRWRNDGDARRGLGEAVARMETVYRKFRGENRLPKPLLHDES